jgi:hypothetical protein
MSTHPALSNADIHRGLRLNMLAGTLGVGWMAMTVSLPHHRRLSQHRPFGKPLGNNTPPPQNAPPENH